MIYIAVFLILTALTVATLAALLIMMLSRVLTRKERKRPGQVSRIKGAIVFLAVLLIINAAVVTVSQSRTYTPQITDEYGNVPGNSVAELKELTLNGRKQWISLRGHDKDNPVLLFLAGGPGGTQMAAVRHELKELEKHFVVVNWDQPGSGKSLLAQRADKITPDTYIEDGYALTNYLKERFGKEKIYLIGESWGSALGIFLISRYPESYHAFIGTGQMVDFVETEKTDYYKALEIAEREGDTGIVRMLKHNGAPPYYGRDVAFKSAVYLNYLSAYMASRPEVKDAGYNTLRDIASPEYGLMDKIFFFAGIINTFNNVYPRLYNIDMRKDYTKVETPVYFFLGRHDYNAPTALAEEYFEILDAPQKEIVWFEYSAHSPWINETDKFVTEVLSCFLGE